MLESGFSFLGRRKGKSVTNVCVCVVCVFVTFTLNGTEIPDSPTISPSMSSKDSVVVAISELHVKVHMGIKNQL